MRGSSLAARWGLRILALGYLGVILAAPLFLVFWNTFEDGFGAAWDAVTTDAALHALTDALYGALGEGDIGTHFPPSDPQWKGADSALFLRHAVDLVGGRGGRIVNLDLTIVCEKPKIAPHVQEMRAKIAEICGISVGRVAVKATTSERLGFTGREEGLLALASTSIELPRED